MNHSDNRDNFTFFKKEHFTNGSVRPGFAFGILLFFWLGCLSIPVITNSWQGKELVWLGASTFMLIFLLAAVILLFQSFELRIAKGMVEWETVVIPGLWKKTFKEPVQNYKNVLIEINQPIGTFSYWYQPRYISHPKRRGGSKPGPADKLFNKTFFATIILEHTQNSRKNISMAHFDAKAKEQWGHFAKNLGAELGLTIVLEKNNSRTTLF